MSVPYDAHIEIIKKVTSVDSGVPSDGDFIYSAYNQEGGGMSGVMPDVNVGDGGNLIGVLKENGNVLESFKTGVIEKLNNVNVTLGTNGVKVNGVDNIVDEIKTMGENSVKEMINNTSKLGSIKTALDNQELNPTINNTVDISPLAKTNEIIANGVTDQIETNQKIRQVSDLQKTELEFNQGVGDSIKDSYGDKVVPMHAKALKDSELGKSQAIENQHDWQKSFIDSLEDIEDEDGMGALLEKIITFDTTTIDKKDTESLFKGVIDG